MFFTKTGKILAYLLFWIGIFGVVYGHLFLFGIINMDDGFAISTVSGARNMRDQGYTLIAVSVALGILSEISSNQKGYTIDNSGLDDEEVS